MSGQDWRRARQADRAYREQIVKRQAADAPSPQFEEGVVLSSSPWGTGGGCATVRLRTGEVIQAHGAAPDPGTVVQLAGTRIVSGATQTQVQLPQTGGEPPLQGFIPFFAS